MAQNNDEEKLPNPCSQCERKQTTAEAEWYCSECEERLCNVCKNLHLTFEATKQHRLTNDVDNESEGNAEGNRSSGTREEDESSRNTLPVLQFMPAVSMVFILCTIIVIIIFNAILGPSLSRFLSISLQKEKSLYDRTAKLSQRINVRLSDDITTPSITSATFLSDGRLLLLDYANKKLKMFDAQINFMKQAEFDEVPLRMAVYDENQVVVTLKDIKSIVRLSVNNSIVVMKIMRLEFRCMGVDFIDRERLVITDPYTNMLYVMTIDGHVLSSISADSAGRKLFHWPWYVAVDRRRYRVYVSNWINGNAVHALDLTAENDVIFTYKHRDLLAPAGIALDQEGNLYICGRESYNIHLVSPDGLYIKTLLSAKDGLDIPLTSLFTPSGDTFIIGSSQFGTAGEVLQIFALD